MTRPARERLSFCDPVYECPAPEWALGAPVGNGHIGAMVWGDGAPLCLTLDRDDLFDLRGRPMDDPEFSWSVIGPLVREGRLDRVKEILDRTLAHPEDKLPAKLPLGRFELDLGVSMTDEFVGRLSLHDATVVAVVDGAGFEVFVAAEEPLVVVRVRDGEVPKVAWKGLADINPEGAGSLGIDPPEQHDDGDTHWAVQHFPAGDAAVIAWSAVQVGGSAVFAATVAANGPLSADGRLNESGLVSLARQRIEGAAQRIDVIVQAHKAWWERFWGRSSVSLSDQRMEALWHWGLYKLASSSRKGHLPANLQGLWVTDGVVPPWWGEYALNMNVQETYWPAYAANHLELAEPLCDWIDRITPAVCERTKRFFGFDGFRIESAVVGDGTPVMGWATVQFWPGAAAWIAHHFWLHWLYGRDRDFLRERAYPFMKLCAAFWLGFLERDENGVLHVPLSHSPEWDGNDLSAWGRDTNIDLALVRNLLSWLLEAAEELGEVGPEQTRWREAMGALRPYLLDEHGELMVMEGVPLSESHRHHSHLMCIHPLGDLNVEGSDEDRQIIERSFHRLEVLGTGYWTGWSFPWMSLIASRVGRAEMADHMLRLYADCFTSPNGFHVNGDWRKTGASAFHYRPYTMEAECAASAAVSEMLLQSWGGKIRLFPTLPERVLDADFERLLAEGAIKVSAKRRGGGVVEVELLAEAGRELIVAGCDGDMEWHGVASAEFAGGEWRVTVGGGGHCTARRPGIEVGSPMWNDLAPTNPFGLRPADVKAWRR